MFDDYMLYLVESLQSHERYNQLLASVRGATTNNYNNNYDNDDDDIGCCSRLRSTSV